MQDLAREARPSTSMACNIFVSQLPLSIQPSLREWLDVREEVGTKEARELIVKVKTALVEKNIPLDYGCRELRKIAVLQREEAPKVRVEPAPEREIPQDESECPAVYITTSGRPGGASRGQGYGQGRSRPFERRSSGRYQQRRRCFICGSNQHFMSQCPERYCPKCGEKGHETRNCPNTKGYRGVFQAVSRQEGIKDTAVVVPMNQPIDVMIDTGADPSFVDKRTIQAMQIRYETKEDRVYGLGRTPLVVCCVARVYIDIGDPHLVDHEIEVLDTDAKTAILGRRFISLYKDTTFDWENWRVKLGEHWVPSLAAVYGGQAVTRAEVILIEAEGFRSTIATGFDINQQLSSWQFIGCWTSGEGFSQRTRRSLRKSGTAEHIITLLDERPIRHRPLRVSPEMEAEVSKQIDEMLCNGIIRPSSSPWASRVILVKEEGRVAAIRRRLSGFERYIQEGCLSDA